MTCISDSPSVKRTVKTIVTTAMADTKDDDNDDTAIIVDIPRLILLKSAKEQQRNQIKLAADKSKDKTDDIHATTKIEHLVICL